MHASSKALVAGSLASLFVMSGAIGAAQAAAAQFHGGGHVAFGGFHPGPGRMSGFNAHHGGRFVVDGHRGRGRSFAGLDGSSWGDYGVPAATNDLAGVYPSVPTATVSIINVASAAGDASEGHGDCVIYRLSYDRHGRYAGWRAIPACR